MNEAQIRRQRATEQKSGVSGRRSGQQVLYKTRQGANQRVTSGDSFCSQGLRFPTGDL